METTIAGYKLKREDKKDIIYCRMDASMIEKLRYIRDKTGISVSELVREAVRKLIQSIDENGSINLSIK